MSIRVTCEHCRKTFKVKDRYAGTRGACPFCSGLINVPTEFIDAHMLESGEDDLFGSSLSLTHLPMALCPSCRVNNLVGSPVCSRCGSALPVGETP